jgi:glutamate dehydrogenase
MSSATGMNELREAIEALDPAVRPGIERLIGQVDEDDLREREPRDVVGSAQSMRALAGKRSQGETLVSVFTPTLREHGWTSRRTIVNICTDDSPFLVDSVAAAIARQGLSVHLLMHPVVSVRRDEAG